VCSKSPAERRELAAAAADRQYLKAKAAAARRAEAERQRSLRFDLRPRSQQKLNWWERKPRDYGPKQACKDAAAHTGRRSKPCAPREAPGRAREAWCQTEFLDVHPDEDPELLGTCDFFPREEKREPDPPSAPPDGYAVDDDSACGGAAAAPDASLPALRGAATQLQFGTISLPSRGSATGLAALLRVGTEQPQAGARREQQEQTPPARPSVVPALSPADVGKRLTIGGDGRVTVVGDRSISARRVLWGRGGASGVAGGAHPTMACATIKSVDGRVGGLVEVEVMCG